MITIANCTFAFGCPRTWDALEADPLDADIRFCRGCERQVFRCRDDQTLNEHVSAGHCVAIERSGAAARPTMYVGRIKSRYGEEKEP